MRIAKNAVSALCMKSNSTIQWLKLRGAVSFMWRLIKKNAYSLMLCIMIFRKHKKDSCKCFLLYLDSKIPSMVEILEDKDLYSILHSQYHACWLAISIHFVNSLRTRWNRRHFADNIFKCIFFYENVWTLLKISLEFVPKVWFNNIPALVQIMAWHLPGEWVSD